MLTNPLPEREWDKIDTEWRDVWFAPTVALMVIGSLVGGGAALWLTERPYMLLVGTIVGALITHFAVESQVRKEVQEHRSRYLFRFEPRR